MPKKYVVDIELVINEVKTFEVDANSEKEAEDEAIRQAGWHQWHNEGGEFCIINCEEKEE
ncbi:hypothetical protein UFOVP1138_70 [uncultured Caudovirales phage]|uniref:Uncharacterized protein n=1 Tax=uncultured Caudovirales phage TaxID=2100421 RepID=A0A6J5QNT7_9CAUD|nr:hypothetical protein UFOVP975_50 [uncultured Caudovirales phage]CAB4186309.1 hypothetical protein UFOVP1138_70 [uncultured Caudovirales phage]CAB4204448.1 hypothetical protein UFOVP1394_67 [uncultured Caudovirales phage]